MDHATLRLEKKGEGIQISGQASLSVREYIDIDSLTAQFEPGSMVICADQFSRNLMKRSEIRMGLKNFQQFFAAMNPAFRQTVVAWTQAQPGTTGSPRDRPGIQDVETVFRGRAQFGRMAHHDSEVELVFFGFALSDFVDARATLDQTTVEAPTEVSIAMYPVCRLTMSTVAVPLFFQTCERAISHMTSVKKK